jgi:putative transposase
MKVQISLPEVVGIFKEIQKRPDKLFEMMRADMRETVGQYLTHLMRAELTTFLGRQPYERSQDEVNRRNATYECRLALKGIGQVAVHVPGIVKELKRRTESVELVAGQAPCYRLLV